MVESKSALGGKDGNWQGVDLPTPRGSLSLVCQDKNGSEPGRSSSKRKLYFIE